MRFFKLEVRELLERRMKEIAEGISSAMGCTAELQIEHNVLPVVNNPEVTGRMRDLFRDFVGDAGLNTAERTMGAEDVGLLMDDIPGTYFFLGAAVPNREAYYGHHHPKFDFDENALPLGVALLSAAVADYVLPG
jgi:metal-dependent amidase/aminoacylase/carboxypeptidase family protein